MLAANDFSPFHCKQDNFNILKVLNIDISTTTVRTCIKPMWNILILNCITNKCIWHTCVTWQGSNYELSEDDTIVSKQVGA